MGQQIGTQGNGCWCCAPQEVDQHGELLTQNVEQVAYSASVRDTAATSPARATGSRGGRSPAADNGIVSFDLILSDLDSAEQIAYGEVFAKLDALHSGKVAIDNTALREFIKANSSVVESELDSELIKAGSLDEGGLALPNFLQLLRDNAILDTVVIEEFLSASSDAVTVTAQDCRSRLLLLAQRRLRARFNEDQWDRIFNTVMMSADVVVSLEQWISYSNHVARIVRLWQFAQSGHS